MIPGNIQAIYKAPLQVSTQRCSRLSTDTVSEFQAKVPQATASEGLGPYVAARVGLEPATLWMKGPNLPMSHHALYTHV